jgi:hypothetical protein
MRQRQATYIRNTVASSHLQHVDARSCNRKRSYVEYVCLRVQNSRAFFPTLGGAMRQRVESEDMPARLTSAPVGHAFSPKGRAVFVFQRYLGDGHELRYNIHTNECHDSLVGCKKYRLSTVGTKNDTIGKRFRFIRLGIHRITLFAWMIMARLPKTSAGRWD